MRAPTRIEKVICVFLYLISIYNFNRFRTQLCDFQSRVLDAIPVRYKSTCLHRSERSSCERSTKNLKDRYVRLWQDMIMFHQTKEMLWEMWKKFESYELAASSVIGMNLTKWQDEDRCSRWWWASEGSTPCWPWKRGRSTWLYQVIETSPSDSTKWRLRGTAREMECKKMRWHSVQTFYL